MMHLRWKDEFEGFAAAADSSGWGALIERRQFAPLVRGQSQQVGICDLGMGNDRIGFEDLKDADIFHPKAVARGSTKPAKEGKHSRDISRPVGVVRVAGDTDKAVFRERTGRPGLPAFFREPAVG